MFLGETVCIIQYDLGQAVMRKVLGGNGMFGGFFVYLRILIKFVRLLSDFLKQVEEAFFKIIVSMKNLVVLSGAGMSAESGISTFRDAGGLWDRYPVEQVATPKAMRVIPNWWSVSIMNDVSSCWK